MRARQSGRLVTGWTCTSCRARQSAKKARALAEGQWRASSSTSAASSTTTAPPLKKARLPDAPARTRFAPSPTGNLHLGSIRTALFNYLLARATRGQFLLRVEDTDAKRTVPGAEERLYEDLRWAGLQWDEGPVVGGSYGPYRQSERLAIYREHAQNLLNSGKAYRCFCSSERIDDLNRRRHAKGLNLGYDRKCSHMAPAQAEERAHRGEAHVLRFRAPAEWPKYFDVVYGKSGHGAEKTKKLLVDEPVYEDAILLKSDGFPTYHFANIVDDHLMRITHVVRGSEWMSSTPLHVALYESMGWTPPAYAHVPLLVDANRQKLSKRNLDVDVASYRRRGFLPESLVNFAALLGWSHTAKNDVFSLAELENVFDLKITKGNTIVSFPKLDYLQEHHALRRVESGGAPLDEMVSAACDAIESSSPGTLSTDGRDRLAALVTSILNTGSIRYTTPADFAAKASVFLDPLPAPLPAVDDFPATLLPSLRTVAATLTFIPAESWTADAISASIRAIAVPDDADRKLWQKSLWKYLRWALLAGKEGPGIPGTMAVLGRDECVARFRDADARSRDLEQSAREIRTGHRSGEGMTGPEKDEARRALRDARERTWQAHSLPVRTAVGA